MQEMQEMHVSKKLISCIKRGLLFSAEITNLEGRRNPLMLV